MYCWSSCFACARMASSTKELRFRPSLRALSSRTIFEVAMSAARVALFNDRIISPLAGPVVDVVTTAKIDLMAGQTLDGLRFYMTYGLCENADVVAERNLLPIGIAEGCRKKSHLKRPGYYPG